MKDLRKARSLLLGTCLSTLLALPGWAGPVIGCDAPSKDFGLVEDAEAVEHTFVIKNTGDANLFIQAVKTSCGCTTTQLKTKDVPAGESVDLGVKLSLKGRSGMQHKTIDILSNDTNQSPFRLELKCESRKSVEVVPAQLNFRIAEDQTNRVMSARVLFRQAKPVQILGITTNSVIPCSARVETAVPGKEFHVMVTLDPARIPQRMTTGGLVTLITDSATATNVVIPLMILVQKPVTVMPDELRLYRQPDGNLQPRKQTLIVQGRQGGTLEVLSMDKRAPGLDIAPAPASANPAASLPNRVRLEVTVAGGEADMTNNAVLLTVRDAAGRTHALTVPVRVLQTTAVSGPSKSAK